MEEEKKVETEESLADIEAREKKHEAQLRFVIYGVIFLFVMIAFFYFIFSSMTNFTYNGKDFQKIRMGELTFYKIAFPLSSTTGQHIADYNIYLRNDPRKLENISINGNITVKNNILITSREDFICGDNNIAIANFIQYFEGVEKRTVNSMANVTCTQNPSGTTLIKIENSTKSGIERVGNDCYVFNVNNCAILNVTEKFLVTRMTSD